jgi:hypothetical protein
MFGNLLIQESGLTGRSEDDRESAAEAVENSHFQINFKFRKYWSGNTVYEEDKPHIELRFCPYDMGEIQHDERGYPYCLNCGSMFPLPSLAPVKPDNKKAYEMRQFLRKLRANNELGGRRQSVGSKAISKGDSGHKTTKTARRTSHVVRHKAP